MEELFIVNLIIIFQNILYYMSTMFYFIDLKMSSQMLILERVFQSIWGIAESNGVKTKIFSTVFIKTTWYEIIETVVSA